MFENLSDREKKLVLAIGALVPIVIVFFVFIRTTSAYKKNNQDIQSLDLRIAEQEELELEGMLADRRQTYYVNASPHPSVNVAGNQYQNWLKSTLKDSGLALSGMGPSAGSRLRSGSETIGESILVKVSVSGTLSQFNEFLSKFYNLDMLHRITEMTLKPENESRSSKPIRSGEITAKMTFEILSLRAGKNRDGFDDFRENLVNSKKNYDAILRRNIFGPANSEPIIKTSNKTTTEGKPYSFSITADDANNNDLLKIELVESDIDKAVLTQTKATDRRAKLEIPDMPPGNYKFKVKVSDTGFPIKSSVKDLVVTVKKKREEKKEVVKTVKPPELEPEVDYIRLVKVTGISKDREGRREVWVRVGPTGERHRLSQGETFEVGEKEYKVVSVDKYEARFAGDEKTFVARPDFDSHGAFIETNQEDL